MTPHQIVHNVLSVILPRQTTVKKIVLFGCDLEFMRPDDTGTASKVGSFAAQLFGELRNVPLYVEKITSFSGDFYLTALGQKVFAIKLSGDAETSLLEFRRDTGVVDARLFKSPPDRRYEFRQNWDGTVSYTKKAGIAHSIGALSQKVNWRGRFEQIPPFLHQSTESRSVTDLMTLSSDLKKGSVLLPADSRSLLVFFGETRQPSSNVVIAHPDPARLRGVQNALRRAAESPSFGEWIKGVEGLSAHNDGFLAKCAAYGVGVEQGFHRLKQWHLRDSVSYFMVDPSTEVGASAINSLFPGDFSTVVIDTPLASLSASTLQDLVSGTSLLSGSETRITLSSQPGLDTALLDSEVSSELTSLQEQVARFRRSAARADLLGKKGGHQFVALDDGAFEAARILVTEAGLEGQILKLNWQKNLLLSSDNRVIPLLQGGRRVN